MTHRDRVAVVTGATSGVGRATARAFAHKGARVALLARGADGLKATRSEIEAGGGEAVDLTVDVADPDQVNAAADEIIRELGPIDIWVNNAMTSVFSPVEELEPEEIKRVMEVTYLGVVNGTLAALRKMRPRDRGAIVQVGSALTYRAIPLQAPYCGAKHAIEGFTESLRTELLHDRSGVRLSIVQLPGLNTPQFDIVRSRLRRKAQPVPPIYQPEVAAKAIIWAADHDRRELWVGGSTVLTILGNRFAPALLDRYLARTNYEAQQTDEPENPNRPDNLWSPVEGDQGAHGRFDERATTRSVQLWLTMHRQKIARAAAAAAATTTAALALAKRSSRFDSRRSGR